MYLFSFMLIVGLLASGTASADSHFGECEPDENGCSECYFSLVKKLLGNDGNVFNLSRMFTPPTFDQPTYVTVNYRFLNCTVLSNDSCVDETHTWLWAKSGAYLLYPLVTFQFISLLFGNAEHLYEREVYVTLDATDCYGVRADHVALLTQRLKVHILEQDFYPKMEESYKAVAVNINSVEEVFFNSFYGGQGLSSEHILFVCPIIVVIAFIIITIKIYVLRIWRWTFKRNHHGFRAPMKINILSFTIISLVRLIIFLIFDGLAVGYELPCTDPRVSAVCRFVQMLYDVPLTLLISDLLLLTFSFVCVAASVVLKLRGITKIRDGHYYCLIFPIIFLIISCILHTPYITMAYLSDAHYATSVLVYYMTILFIELGLIHHTLKVFFDLRNNVKGKYLIAIVAVCVIFVLIVVYGLVISLSFFYYYIPINNTITDLPNEGIIVYQTALLLAGAYITYKAVFQKERKLKEIHAIDDSICRMNKAEITNLNGEIADMKEKISLMKSVSSCEAKVTLKRRFRRIRPQRQASGVPSSLAHCFSNVHKRKMMALKDSITQKKKRIDVLQKEIWVVYIHRSIMHLTNTKSNLSSDGMLSRLRTQETKLLKCLKNKIPPNEYNYFSQRIEERRQDNDELENDHNSGTTTDDDEGAYSTNCLCCSFLRQHQYDVMGEQQSFELKQTTTV